MGFWFIFFIIARNSEKCDLDSFYSCENLSSHLQKVCQKILVNVGIMHLELTPGYILAWCQVACKHYNAGCVQWSRYLGYVDMGKVKCIMFNSWWPGTNNSKFYYCRGKGLCVVIIVKVKSKKWLSVIELRWRLI